MSRFFIDRPIFAWVLAILVSLAGILSLTQMPVEQYPPIAPPAVSISASLPGASADIVENTVTQVIEQGLTGIDNLRYFASTSASDGSANITITFEPGTNADIAQMQVQNKLQAIMALLPQTVKNQGINVSKGNSTTLMFFALYTEDNSIPQQTLGDILSSTMKDAISRVDGVGSVGVFAGQHAMRIWLDPNKLYSYNLTATDAANAITDQNINVASGQLAGLPASAGQQLNATIMAGSILKTIEDFEQIILKTNTDGSAVYLKDIAKISIGGDNYSNMSRYNGKTSTGMAIRLAPGANALDVVARVKAKINDLMPFLPAGVKVAYPYDTTPFVRISIEKVIHTLIEAFVLVFLVIFLFLQNFRSTFIPTIVIPVVILGTFAILHAFGFSINTLTMFALVLSIGLLVDDAIVVVENVERLMQEEGLSPLEATRKSMDQIKGALIGIAMVISAVFIPMAFFGGSVGGIYRQFSITIVASMGLSVLVALILAPSLCATMLKRHDETKGFAKMRLFKSFNIHLQKVRNLYTEGAHAIALKRIIFIAVYGLVVAGAILLFLRMPKSFLPNEDQGLLFGLMTTPTTATLERTSENMQKLEQYFLEHEKENVMHVFGLSGYGFAGTAQNSGLAFIMLKDWSQRKRKDQSAAAVAMRATMALSQTKDAIAFVVSPPPIRELGNASGFEMQLIDLGGNGHAALMAARGQVLYAASQNKMLMGVRPNGLDDVPQYVLDINYSKSTALGVAVSDITDTLNYAWGSVYINDFLDNGRVKKVIIQGETKSRMSPKDIDKWFVRNMGGQMIPFSSFTKSRWGYGSPSLERFNGLSSINIQGMAAPGVSSEAAMKEMEKIVSTLPPGFGLAWSGLSYEEKMASANTTLLYVVSTLIVFLALAALYESWSVPFAVILIVPFGILGAVAASTLTGMANDVYFQVALLTIIGLSAKNAILIVEFAKDLYEKDHDLLHATIEAVKQRFRPILMTSMAFMLGVVPLAISSGAGSAAQNALGIAVLGGMMFATFLTPLFVPLFYILMQRAKRASALRGVSPDGEISETEPEIATKFDRKV